MAQLGLRLLFQIEGSLRVAGAKETLGTAALEQDAVRLIRFGIPKSGRL